MSKDTLELKAQKAVLSIDNDIKSVIRDLSMKLCYLIQDKRLYYDPFFEGKYPKK